MHQKAFYVWLGCVLLTGCIVTTQPTTPATKKCESQVLAYQDRYRITLVNAIGEKIKTLEDNDDQMSVEEEFRWSPNGRYIAYASAYPGNGGPGLLKLIDVETGEIKKLVEASVFDFTWSPDSTQLVFYLIGNSLLPYIPYDDGMYHLNLSSEKPEILIKRDQERHGILTGGHQWSPSDDKVAYAVSMYSTADSTTDLPVTAGLAVFDFRTLTQTVLYTVSAPIAISWSPDGKKIVFATNPSSAIPGQKGDIFIINEDGTNLRNVTNEAGVYTAPSWVSNGEELLFAYSPTDITSMNIYAVKADGSDKRKLSTKTLVNPMPIWSPDDACIAYLDNDGLVVMSADGYHIASITQEYRPHWYQWQPKPDSH